MLIYKPLQIYTHTRTTGHCIPAYLYSTEPHHLVEKVVELERSDNLRPLQLKALRHLKSLIPVLRVGGSSPFRRANRKAVKPLIFLWFRGFFLFFMIRSKSRFLPILTHRVVEKVVELFLEIFPK